jgi:hypothetical protein
MPQQYTLKVMAQILIFTMYDYFSIQYWLNSSSRSKVRSYKTVNCWNKISTFLYEVIVKDTVPLIGLPTLPLMLTHHRGHHDFSPRPNPAL